MSTRAVIQSIGHCIPEGRLTNDDLMKIVDTSDAWIVQRTGIKERRICRGEEEGTGWMCLNAGREAIARAGIDPLDLDMVVVGTVSGDYPWPSTAAMVQAELGATNAGAFDVSAACAGFIYSLQITSAMIRAGDIKTALVIGGDAMTKQVDWTDRSTCVLFGDAAAGVVLRAEENTDRGVIDTILMSDGNGRGHISIEVGGSKYPWGTPQAEGKRACITMNGAETYRFAITAMGDACEKVLARAGMSISDVDLFVPHQANLRIIESATARLGITTERVFVNVQKYGNTSGGSVPLGLYEAEQEGRLQRGMVVMTVGFGAGLVWGANLIRW